MFSITFIFLMVSRNFISYELRGKKGRGSVLFFKMKKCFSFLFLFFTILSYANAEKMEKFAIFPKYSKFLKNIPDEVKKTFYFRTACSSRYIALTFDDGPVKKTKEIVSLLKEKDVPATFFVVCNNLNSKNVLLYQNSLFEIGMHSFMHGDYRKFSDTEIEKDVALCVAKFKKLELPVQYFRPGYGVINTALSRELEKFNLKGVLWSIDSFDWDGCKGALLVNRIISNLSPGSIVLFHDRVNVSDLRKIIDEIRKKDFIIVPLKTILEFPGEYL